MNEEDKKIYEASKEKKLVENHEKPLWETLSKEELEKLIYQFNGLTFDICKCLKTTPKKYWNAVDKFGLRELVKESRNGLLSRSECVLNDLLNSEDERIKMNVAQFILERLGKNEGWSKSPDIQQQFNISGDADIRGIFGV